MKWLYKLNFLFYLKLFFPCLLFDSFISFPIHPIILSCKTCFILYLLKNESFLFNVDFSCCCCNAVYSHGSNFHYGWRGAKCEGQSNIFCWLEEETFSRRLMFFYSQVFDFFFVYFLSFIYIFSACWNNSFNFLQINMNKSNEGYIET